MAIITNTVTPPPRLTLFRSATDQARLNSVQPRGVCTFSSLDSGNGSGAGDQDQFIVTMDFPREFAYLVRACRITLGGSTAVYVREMYQPVIQGIGLFGMLPDDTWLSGMRPCGADIRETAQPASPSVLGRVSGTSYSTFYLPRDQLPAMPIVETGLPTTVLPQILVTWQQDETTTDYSSSTWTTRCYLEALIYDVEQIQGAVMNTPS